MKAVKIDKFGTPDVLKVEDIEIGTPQSNEVLIKNLSIGINLSLIHISEPTRPY